MQVEKSSNEGGQDRYSRSLRNHEHGEVESVRMNEVARRWRAEPWSDAPGYREG